MHIPLKFLYLFIQNIAFLVSATENYQCGVSSQSLGAGPPSPAGSQRIINGQNHTKNLFPWLAQLVDCKSPNQKLLCETFCGGTLIHKNFVISAAHCLVNKYFEVLVVLGYDDLYDTNKIGQTRTRISQESSGKQEFQSFSVNRKDIYLHENYDSSRGINYNNDIAILHLKGAGAAYTNSVRPICLLNLESQGNYFQEIDDNIESQTRFTIAGWGSTSYDFKNGIDLLPSKLQYASVKLINQEYCQRWYENSFLFNNKPLLSNNMFCAGYIYGGTDACKGDSGGPLMVNDLKTNQWSLIGIISWGYGCAEKMLPGVYTKVGNYFNWIEDMKDVILRKEGYETLRNLARSRSEENCRCFVNKEN